MSFLLFLSVPLFAISIYLFRRANVVPVKRFVFSILVLIAWVNYLLYFVSDYFTGEGVNYAVIYHLKYGLEGAGFSAYSKLILMSGLFIAVGFIFSGFIHIKKNHATSSSTRLYYGGVLTLLLSLMTSPATADMYSMFIKPPHSNNVRFINSDFMKYYKQPLIKKDGEQKNLVIIYAEGLERTYFNEDVFPGLMNGLRKLESLGTSFTNIKQVTGTGWTIAGIVSGQCGIPLFALSHGNSMSGAFDFLPLAYCLSDFLHDEGYYLSYYGGADLTFAGKRNFLSTHSFDEIQGRDELLPKMQFQSYRNSWGLFDDSLFALAYKRFIELSNKGEKFALTMLTLDTHHPAGQPSMSCAKGLAYQNGSNPILNAVVCSDYLITRFVSRIMQSPYASNTIVVIVSDHLSMKNTAYNSLNSVDRRNMFIVIDPGSLKTRKVEKSGSMLDFASSILPFIGYRGAIGLGRNLSDPEQSGAEIQYIQEHLNYWKPSIVSFWDFPVVREQLSINFQQETMNIDDRVFKIPALVEFTPELETTIRFDFDRSKTHKTLLDYVLMLDKDTPFLLIDECRKIEEMISQAIPSKFCIIAGQGDSYRNIVPLYPNTVTLSPEDIKYFTCLSGTNEFKVHRVAHAGGGIDGRSYTNSLEALEHNIKKGFKYFELDFSFTNDDQLVCIHDWEGSFKRSFGIEATGVPSYNEFNQLVKNSSRYNKCTLDTLAHWMKENPSAVIVTDVKDNNPKALKLIKEKLPDFSRRVIPQIYQPQNYKAVKALGYEQIIWTLYRYRGTYNDVMKWTDSFEGLFAITMSKEIATSGLSVVLAQKRIPTYVHTVNLLNNAKIYANIFGATEIYTDFLTPEQNKTCISKGNR